MARGEPIWHTSSTGPTSMPSSREAVATRARRSPARRRCSTILRRAADRLPWWAATCRAASTGSAGRSTPSGVPSWPCHPPALGPGASAPSGVGSASGSPPRRRASWWATRSAILRVLTKTRVVRWSRTWPAMRSRTSPSWPPLATASSSLSGSSMATSRSRRCPQSTMAVGERDGSTPDSRRETTARGRWVAERPIRCRRPPPDVTTWSSRSRVRARWAPRLSRARVCTSSTMTVWTPARRAREEGAVSRR